MKVSALSILSLFFIPSVNAQDVSYNTITTTSNDSNNPTSIRILGQNDPVGFVSARNISFEFAAAGKAQIQAYRNSSMGTTLQFLTNDDGDPINGAPSVRMQISRNGNVGIGTAVPSHRLTVLMDAGTNGEGVAVQAVNSTAAGSQPGYAFLNSSGSKRMYSYLDVSSDTYNIGNASGVSLMTVSQNGNVGIGINTPSDKLAVNGNVRAKEVKVENTNWPDFVFAKSYALPTLQEVENHIKEKSHLPGIPSATEVKSNGIDLGEMNAKLLQKIEELTLYLIEMRKNNEKLENRVMQLELKNPKPR